MDVERFREPPNEYREVPFWSWNEYLDPEELVRQVALMDEAGWGGFFMHARVGLLTAYMGPQWMACVRACVDAARERGLRAWLYDEDKWPSGFAGGLSVAGHPAYRSQYLVCKVDDRPALAAERIATFAARQVGGRLVDVRPAGAPDLAGEADRVIQFYPQAMPLGFEWFNGYAYLDVLNPDAVRAFLESTHVVYARAVGQDFGATVPGIFTDEPGLLYGGREARGQPVIPWTDGFLAYFRARNGYDLLPHLPALFFDGLDAGDCDARLDTCAVRYDYWRTVTERFLDSYTRQVYEWCTAHGLAYTGHYNAEDTLLSQIPWLGAAMPHYAYMHIPGIDKLGRQINAHAGTVLTVKQLDSVACQLGKPRTLCENYGCSGQDFAHTGRKWIGDWAYVLGVNLNNPHLSLYSMRGERKRDFPQNVFYQQPWWPENRLIADYFARLSYVLSQGQRVVDILVIHPVGSAWTLYRPGARRAVDELDRALDELLTALLEGQRDFHLGDEMLMAPGAPAEARVTADAAGPRLVVGQMAYRVVIVPPGVTLAGDTVRLLREFAAAGGPVLALEPLPTRVDGRSTGDPVLSETVRVFTCDALTDALDALLPFDVRVPGRPAIWAHHRRIGEADCYFLANTDRDRGGVATVRLRGTGRLEAWDPAEGDVCLLPSRQADGITEVVLDFPAVGSHLLVLHRDQAPEVRQATETDIGCENHTPTRNQVFSAKPGFSGQEPAPSEWRPCVDDGAPSEGRALLRTVVAEIPLGGDWHLALGGPNALTLDTPQLRIGDRVEAWSKPMHVLDAHVAVAEAGVGTPFALRFSFDATVRLPDPVYLVVESPGCFDVAVNGQPVETVQDDGWWTDVSFRKVDVSAAVRAGQNEAVLSGVFGRDTELESVYLIGDFGVSGERLGPENRHNGQVFDRYISAFWVTALPERVRSKRDSGGLSVDLTAQGLPFFAGRATLRQTVTLPPLGGRGVLEIEGLRAALAHVRVNGRDVGTVAWPPHRVDVTPGLRSGENVIEIELVGTLRNLLGPHHLAGGDLSWTGPEEFRDKRRWTDDVILVPFGFEGVRLVLLE